MDTPTDQAVCLGAMEQVARAPFDRALQRARQSAFAPGEFVGQESFMRASEIRALAVEAGIGPGVSVLDLCCGVAGPGRFIAREHRCSYVGVDSSADAVEIARERACNLDYHFEVARIPPLPPGPFEVVLLLETMLAFADKPKLLREISRALEPGGRFAFTLEEGTPLTKAERARMPHADTVWLIPLLDVRAMLEDVGLRVREVVEYTPAHLAVVNALTDAFEADASDIAAQIGHRAFDELQIAHRLWSTWMRSGRVRKLALVAVKEEPDP